MPLHAIEMSGLPNIMYQNTERRRRAGAGREVCVHGDDGNAQIGRRERRAWIEAHPSEEQNECTGHDEHEVVSGEGPRLAVLAIFSKRGPR